MRREAADTDEVGMDMHAPTDGAEWRIVGLHHVAFAHAPGSGPEDALCDLLDVVPHEEPGPGFLERMFPVGDAYVQTLEATGDGVVQKFLDRRGPGLHHVAFEVDGSTRRSRRSARAGYGSSTSSRGPGGWERASPSCTPQRSGACWSSSWSFHRRPTRITAGPMSRR